MMKIRTRLLLSLLPTLIIGLGLVLILLCCNLPTDISSYVPLAIASIGILILTTAFSLYYIAGKISRRIKKLNNSALAMAAGHYGQSIEIRGAKELGELANTLNTMSECLLENINHLKENSQQREQAYGETACARLLQQHLLQKSIDECASDAIAIKAITFTSDSPRGMILNFPRQSKEEHFVLQLAEAKEEGVDGMYELLSQYKLSKELPAKPLPFSSLSLLLDRENSTIRSKSKGFPNPLFWSHSEEELSLVKGAAHSIKPGDFVFLMNQPLSAFFKSPERLSQLFTKVLKVFAQEGLESCAAMLQKEIAFQTKRKELDDDLHLICLQILSPEI